MENDIRSGAQSRKLYLSVYRYYKEQILEHRLPPGSRMPSVRKGAQELKLSRTTMENAYLQLAAEGYIISKAQSGFYVTDIAEHQKPAPSTHVPQEPEVKYNLSSSRIDREGFRLDIWKRYLKSALRQEERLLSYGDPQGEPDLREALSVYVREHRNVLCTPEDIVVGAGVQSLLHILCPLVREKATVSFPTESFLQGRTVFADYGFQVFTRNRDCGVIYVSPAHMTRWGEIMPFARRLELVHYAEAHGSIIIEDDFENEFVYAQKPTPSLFALAGGKGVVYIGSFSRLLMPSVRLSFMILPPELKKAYASKASSYNQTASKAEQIALCQYIRDGHLASQTRKLRRVYAQKLQQLTETVKQVFGDACTVRTGSAGTALALTVPTSLSGTELVKKGIREGLRLQILEESPGELTILLSCSALPCQDFLPACTLLKQLLQ